MRKHFIMLLLLLVTIISGCAKEEIPELLYTVEWISIPNPDEAFPERLSYMNEDGFRFAEGKLYRLVSLIPDGEEKVKWYFQTLSDPYGTWETEQLNLSELTPILVTDEHTYYILDRGLTKLGEIYMKYGEVDEPKGVAVLQDGHWVCYDSLPTVGDKDTMFFADTEGIYRKQDGQDTEILNWESYGLRFAEAPAFWSRSEDTFLILKENGAERSLIRMTKGTGEEQAQKQKIVMAAYASSELQKAMAAFNQQSDLYEVVLQDCSKKTTDELIQRFQTEMMTGNGPDLIDSLFIELYPYAKNGYLEPLDEQLDGKNLLPQAVESGKVDEHFYVAPYRFSLQTLVSIKEVVGDRTQWTLDEMRQTMENHQPNEVFSMGNDGFAVLHCMLCYDEENAAFVDWENRRCHFDTEEFVSLMELAAQWADPSGVYATPYMGEEIREGHMMVIRSVRGVGNRLEDYVENLKQMGESCVYIGFPVKEGNGTFLEGMGFALNRSSECKEGAREFLNYLMSEEYQMQIWEEEERLPVNLDAFQTVMEGYAAEAQSGESKTEEKDAAAEYFQLLLQSKPLGNRYDGIVEILREETSGYFLGNRDPWEVARTLQNRVQLYLDEK